MIASTSTVMGDLDCSSFRALLEREIGKTDYDKNTLLMKVCEIGGSYLYYNFGILLIEKLAGKWNGKKETALIKLINQENTKLDIFNTQIFK